MIRQLSLLTFIVFLTMKLCGVDWSWGFILLPAASLWGTLHREAEIERAIGKDLTNV